MATNLFAGSDPFATNNNNNNNNDSSSSTDHPAPPEPTAHRISIPRGIAENDGDDDDDDDDALKSPTHEAAPGFTFAPGFGFTGLANERAQAEQQGQDHERKRLASSSSSPSSAGADPADPADPATAAPAAAASMSTSTDNTAAASPFSGFGGFGGFGGFSMSVNCDGSAGGNGRDGGNGRAPAPRSSGHAATEDPREHGRRAEEEDDDDPRAAGPPRAAADTSRSAAHLLPPNYGLARRTSVSAESLNPSTYAQDNWTPPVHPKTREQLARLKAAVQGIILFNSLDEPQMETILQALVEKPVPAKGIKIIAQGDQGDFFYVIETGSFDVYKHESGCVQSGPDGLGAKVATLKPGEFFGELALMYNAPRSASVVSADNRSTVWALDRITFRRILLDSAFNRRSMYEAFLEEVPILSSLKPYERSKIADALRTAKFKPGDTIIAEGEPGENFYLLESGTANAFKAGVLDEHVPVMRYQRGDYFGELALLDDKPRRATIVAETDVTVAMLHRDGFKRLLGPVQNIMRRTSYDAGRPSTAGSASPAAAARGKQEEEVTAGETEAAKNAEKDEEEAAAKRNSNSKEKEIEAALQVDGAQDCPADGAAAQDQAQAQAQAQGQADRDDAAAARGKTPTPTVEVGKKRLRASPDSTEEGS